VTPICVTYDAEFTLYVFVRWPWGWLWVRKPKHVLCSWL